MTTINGNAKITITETGTRVIDYEDKLYLDHPLNVDIRVSNRCSFGQREDGSWVLCNFCHENAQVNGRECDYTKLKKVISELPGNTELAIGSNNLTPDLIEFLKWSSSKGYINNLTINQGHLRRDMFDLLYCIENNYIKGLGVSYRSSLCFNVPIEILEYEHTVFHVILGIDTFEDVTKLSKKGVKKILILGEKDFGGNAGKVNIDSLSHKQWRWWISKLFNKFEVLAFDNLAIEQLKLKRFFSDSEWNTFYQGEHSFYIDAVEEVFKPSSRVSKSTPYTNIKKYFKNERSIGWV